MSNPNLSNPEKLVNEARLNEYHQTILPYLGGHIECGFTPVGAVIMMSGNEAPKHYLKCDGTVYNIADYPELAAFYARSQGSCNFYGGNGTTTFAVPDYRGEFVRCTGTNSHANCGNGANVGVHQDSTLIPDYRVNSSVNKLQVSSISDAGASIIYPDAYRKSASGTIVNANITAASGPSGLQDDTVSVRPTNTSVLFCVASKNIYLDARFDYSLEEKVVGEWIDGKPIYQRTIVLENIVNIPANTWTVVCPLSFNVDSFIGCAFSNENKHVFSAYDAQVYNDELNVKSAIEINVRTITIQYTKTTDA